MSECVIELHHCAAPNNGSASDRPERRTGDLLGSALAADDRRIEGVETLSLRGGSG
jgi:hypothetical protein